MATCAHCGAEVAASARFCAACGTPLSNSDQMATFDFTPPSPARTPRVVSGPGRPPSSSGAALSEGRFLPGHLIAGRYRVIALLGRGGMGEVYRADDLTLGQPVALKFLPEQAASDEGLLERFRNEVRVARRVSHPNVCRVYDVGEVDGHTFFTMEYVDGEDLASLLRRIGRLPQDKALDIARQLCAGLSAAHIKGVLHRDMKPANIMLDGRGQVVITDFGLAGLAGQIPGTEVRSGTPAYMAPEQLAGNEVTARSDIYSLGLVLYEVFTGKRAFGEEPATSRLKGDKTVSRPSSVVKNLDPAVERVILRCLESEPSARPANVLSIAAALPGGDPLAAALAAGETPSPQMVAAAGEAAGLRPRIAVACFAAVLVGLALCVYLSVRGSALDKMGLELSPEVLTQKAREMAGKLGYEKHPRDSASGFYNNGDLTRSIEQNDKPRPDWNRILPGRPSLIQFWYRQSPRYMVPSEYVDLLMTPGIIQTYDPPTIISGMLQLELDPQGRLIYLLAIPPELETESSPPASFDWSVLFGMAGLDRAQFQVAQPQWDSLGGGDTRVAWTGVWPGSTRPLRIEGASRRGKPVFFSLIGEWTKAQRQKADDESGGARVRTLLMVVLLVAILGGAGFLARRNYRQGRGDRQGAFRLALVMFGLEIALWLCRSHLVADIATLGLLVLAVSSALFISGTAWLLYLALEPWIRRSWPQAIISWSRLLAGKVRDPLVGRDVLWGILLGLALLLVIKLRSMLMMHMGAAPELYSDEYLVGGRQALGAWLSQIPSAILGTLEFFILLLGLKKLVRKDWIAAILFVAIFTGVNTPAGSYLSVRIPAQVLIYALVLLTIYRFGLVSLACSVFTIDMLANVPFSGDFSAWYMTTSIFALLSVVALASWAFFQSLGSERLWAPESDA